MPRVARDAGAHEDEREGTIVESRISAIPAVALDRVDGRYEVEETLGRGGSAIVYRARDLVTHGVVALKQLLVPKTDRYFRQSTELFQSEFHTLAGLSHPRIVKVEDYGVTPEGPYYTMELLDGGDLRERSPLPWREASQAALDVCSALALLHSRRLVHRDVSPRNVRLTRGGRAKLIDLGAMVPMGPSSLIVGTPAFVAPEVVYRATLDARTDLFSLGATLYYALTGRPPFPVRDFAELFAAWAEKPRPPSHYAGDVPEALDAIVLSLLSVDAATRPRTAFDVIERLSAVASLDRAEPIAVSRAYLSTPGLVGREGVLEAFRREAGRAFEGRGRGVLLEGPAGSGRSRVLDACAFFTKTSGALVLRAGGGVVRREDFAVAQDLVEQLLETAPDTAIDAARSSGALATLFSLERPAEDADLRAIGRPRPKRLVGSDPLQRVAIQTALLRWFLQVSRARPLCLAIDDVHLIDEPSAAFVATLASNARKHPLLVAATVDRGARPVEPRALEHLAAHSDQLRLEPLDRAQTEALLGSLFGDAQNLGALGEEVFRVAAGNPRASMDIAQHLVDHGIVRYAAGAWSLPERLGAGALPGSAEEALAARLARLSPAARGLVEAQSLTSTATLRREDYFEIAAGLEPGVVDSAIAELVTAQVLVSDGRAYTIAHAGISRLLSSALSAEEAAERHLAMSRVHDGKSEGRTIWHLLFGGAEEKGLDRLVALLDRHKDTTPLFEEGLTVEEIGRILEFALSLTTKLGRPPRQSFELRRWLASFSVAGGERYYWEHVPPWLDRLVVDSGLDAYRRRPESEPAAERLSAALQEAYGRYMATPDSERGYRPDEAIRGLVQLVAISLAISSRTLDLTLCESLPDLLAPFAPMSATVQAIHENALAARESVCRAQPESAHARWAALFDRLAGFSGEELEARDLIRRAVAYALGGNEAWMGLPDAARWADHMKDDVLHAVNALYLERVVRLQQGDAEGAERLRKTAEIRSVQARARQMFTNLNALELNSHTLSRDLTGLRQTIDRIRTLAAGAPGWVPYVHLGEGRFQLVCGNFDAALAEVDHALELVAPDPAAPYPLHGAWIGSVAARVEALTNLDRAGEAAVEGRRALELCERLGIGLPTLDLTRAVAFAETKLGELDAAAARLDDAAAIQIARGTTGLLLGATHEARARVALAAGDEEGFEHHARLTAREYRHGRGSALGARYEALMEESRKRGPRWLPNLADFSSQTAGPSSLTGPYAASEMVTYAMRGAGSPAERAERVLALLCRVRGATVGHLYLVEGGGVRHVASQGAARVPAGVQRFAERYLSIQVAQHDVATAFVSADQLGPSAPAPGFVDEEGRVHSPVVLAADRKGATHYVGVALLICPARRRMPVDNDLAVALALHLLHEGDVNGVHAAP